MKTKTYTTYKFNELNEKQKEKVLQNYYDINVDSDWWEPVYEGAKEIGLKITGFDLGSAQECDGKFITTALDCARAIVKEHGETCETYKTASAYIKEIDALEIDDDSNFIDEEKADDITTEFLHSLLEDYRIMLEKEYEYLTGKEAIIETIEANDYDFTDDGRIN